MAKFNFNEYSKREEANSQSRANNFSGPSWFWLQNDGDEAIVRFPYSSVNEFELVSVHTLNINNRFRDISCLRSAEDSVDKCPMCAAGEPVKTRFYVRLLEYVKQDDGTYKIESRVWNRAPGFGKVLQGFIQEYGDLRNVVFKIKRHGAKGDMNTTYEVLFANPAIYKPEIFKADFSGFDKFSLFNYFVLDRNFNEMTEWVNTGKMPMPEPRKREEQPKQEVPQTPVNNNQHNPAPQVVNNASRPQRNSYNEDTSYSSFDYAPTLEPRMTPNNNTQQNNSQPEVRSPRRYTY